MFIARAAFREGNCHRVYVLVAGARCGGRLCFLLWIHRCQAGDLTEVGIVEHGVGQQFLKCADLGLNGGQWGQFRLRGGHQIYNGAVGAFQ